MSVSLARTSMSTTVSSFVSAPWAAPSSTATGASFTEVTFTLTVALSDSVGGSGGWPVSLT